MAEKFDREPERPVREPVENPSLCRQVFFPPTALQSSPNPNPIRRPTGICVLLLLPLYFTEAVNMPQFQKTLLVAPPPPPAPPPAAVHVMPRVPKSFFTKGQLFAPKFIPKKVAEIREQAPPPAASGVAGGVIGGVPGGQLGGVLAGILGGIGHGPAPPRPTRVAHQGPYRVGGKVEAPLLIRQVQPEYPPLAKQARIQGEVVIDSVIDAQGRVTQMRVVSGSPLLVQSATGSPREMEVSTNAAEWEASGCGHARDLALYARPGFLADEKIQRFQNFMTAE